MFTLTSFSYDSVVTSSINVRMTDRFGEEFANDDGDLDEPWSLQLDPGDGHATVTATYEQAPGEDPLSPDGPSCTQTVSKTVRGYRYVALSAHCDSPEHRPVTIIIACGDGNFRIAAISGAGLAVSTAGFARAC